MPSPRLLPLVFLLFVGSGCAALIYEVVWFQLLQLVIGSSAVSLAVLLGTFMGGMGLGSLLLPRWLRATSHPLRVYAVLEAGVAVCGGLVLLAVPVLGHAYTALAGHGAAGLALRALLCAACLLPPTVLMGATLPAIARWVEASPRGVAWLGFFYGGNTLGAVLGCLLAGFWLLRVHDTTIATLCAAALNLAVAGVAWLLARRAPAAPPLRATGGGAPAPARAAAPVLWALALSGFCALAAEVVWARLLSLLLGATVYTFAIILAVFLAGIALGSGAGAALARTAARPHAWLAGCQLLLIAAIAWAAHAIAIVLPRWEAPAALPLAVKFGLDLGRCALALLPAALLWGASFPLALAGLAGPGRDPARLVGRAYAANTAGAIAGAGLAGLALVPWLGAQRTQLALAAAAALAAALAVSALGRRMIVGLLGAAALAGAHVVIPPVPWQLVAYGRQAASTDYGARPIYLGEGVNATVAVTETPDGARYFHVSGKTEASSLEKDMRLQLMLGHLPALLHPHPRSVLIVGCGAGVTAGTFVLHPSIERIVICDIEPLIPRVVAAHFAAENHGVIRDPRVQIVHDDARHFIATTRERFDIVTSDPIHPWVKGSAVLYSREYFALCRARLKPGGLMTQWVPLYESDRAVVQSELATFFSVFPHATIWGNDDDGGGYDTVLLGQAEAPLIDLPALQARLARPDHAAAQGALARLGLGRALDLLSTYAGNLPDLREWLAPAEINRDRTLRLQYLAGLKLESAAGAEAYREILGLRRFPANMFRASPAELSALRRRLDLAAGEPW